MIIAEQVRCGHFLPVGFEVSFGGQDDALAGLKITLPDGSEVEIQGIIDRLDIAVAPDGTEYLRVIDYKTGGRELALADIYGGRSWQMPVYMQTVLANRTAKRVCALPAGMFYTSIKEVLRNGQSRQEAEASANPQLKLSGMAILDERAMRLAGDIEQEKESYILNMRRKKDGTVAAPNALTPKEFAVVQKYIMDGVALTLERIKKGEIAPCPEQEGTYLTCDYCDYTVLCALSRELNKDVRPNSAVNLTKEEIIGLMQGKEEEVGDE
jgi:ATP-dependent helicase/nuclease subunit B